ncbi:hypothetical protein [Nitrosomonas sp. Nm33]|uniref:hypothetical protein n=1 Tax=Nitrosomonas sp. Nm33 TaxID=133724 RepID=UPI000896242C|nr:hypothetical protein [Nitrosomonas sp. Nm33]SDY32137.1 hypothetical protein SAMN05421755_10167 [Nitrosomonas sp. Nm33]
MTVLVFGDPELNPALGGEQKGKSNSLIGLDNFGFNVLVGDTGFMYDSSLGGNDTLEGGNNSIGGSVFNGLAGDALEMYDYSLGGHDTLYGGDLQAGVNGNITNYLLGDAITMYDASKGGDDVIHGGNNGNNDGTGIVENYLYGDAIEMNGSTLAVLVQDHYGKPDDHHVSHHVKHDNGKKHVEHEDDDDDHDDDHDHKHGHKHDHKHDDDVVFINASPLGGNDILISGSNAIDHMYGDAGNALAGGEDTFVFNDEVGTFFGDDIIYDFRQSDGLHGDQIEIDFADVDFTDLVFTDDFVTGDQIITVHGDHGDHGTITLVGLAGVHLTVGHAGDPGDFDIII